MSYQSDLGSIRDTLIKLDTNRVERLSYTQNAFDNELVDGVTTFDVNAEQNIPAAGYDDYNPTIHNKGLRSQGASIPRNSLNHFYGRLSYNVNKLIQKLRAFILVDIASKAHNANEYDASAPYASGDVCYMMEAQGVIRSYVLYQRTSSAPATISGIAVTDTNHWTKVQPKVKGIHKDYQIADLTALNSATWYPAVTTLQDFQADTVGTKDGATRIRIEAYMNGTIALLPQPVRADLVVDSKFTGWAASSTDIVEDASCIGNTDGTDFSAAANNPIGYSKLPLGRQAVIWLRGGAKYAIWNSFGSAFTLYTGSYNNGLDGAVSPSASRVFAVNNARILADADLLDGLHAYRFLSREENGSANLISGSNINTVALSTGIYLGFNLIGAPTAEGYFLEVMNYAGGINDYTRQTLWPFGAYGYDSSANKWTRTRRDGGAAWEAWTKEWNSSNDGPGSGLDADLFGSMPPSQFIRHGNTDGSAIQITGGNLDTAALPSGFYCGNSIAGAPTGDWYFIEVFNYSGNNSWSRQVAYPFQALGLDSNTNAWTRSRNNVGAWYPWKKMWNSGNGGVGSGLDAGLLCGVDPRVGTAGSAYTLILPGSGVTTALPAGLYSLVAPGPNILLIIGGHTSGNNFGGGLVWSNGSNTYFQNNNGNTAGVDGLKLY